MAYQTLCTRIPIVCVSLGLIQTAPSPWLSSRVTLVPAACAQVLLQVWARSGGPGEGAGSSSDAKGGGAGKRGGSSTGGSAGSSIDAGVGGGAEGSSSTGGGAGGCSGVGDGGGLGSIADAGGGSSGRQRAMLSVELQERLDELLELDAQVDEMWDVHKALY